MAHYSVTFPALPASPPSFPFFFTVSWNQTPESHIYNLVASLRIICALYRLESIHSQIFIGWERYFHDHIPGFRSGDLLAGCECPCNHAGNLQARRGGKYRIGHSGGTGRCLTSLVTKTKSGHASSQAPGSSSVFITLTVMVESPSL